MDGAIDFLVDKHLFIFIKTGFQPVSDQTDGQPR